MAVADRTKFEGVSPITLGTAQIGMSYGAFGPSSPPDEATATAIFDTAAAAGISSFDTAGAYGMAERRLGGWIGGRRGPPPFVVNKLPSLTDEADDDPGAAVGRYVEGSRAALGLDRLSAYLVHRAADLHRPGVLSALRAQVAAGKIGVFGASVYTLEDAAACLAVDGLALLQVPVSLLNQAFVGSGVLAGCADRGVMVMARSVFVQGLLVGEPADLPPHLRPAKKVLARLRVLADGANVSMTALALGAASQCAEIDTVVVGVKSVAELEDIVAASRQAVAADLVAEAFRIAQELPENIVDPRAWPKPG